MADGFDFTGKTVMVFGGTSGINLGIAKAFARAGATLAVASRSQDKVDAAVAALSGGTPAGDGATIMIIGLPYSHHIFLDFRPERAAEARRIQAAE